MISNEKLKCVMEQCYTAAESMNPNMKNEKRLLIKLTECADIINEFLGSFLDKESVAE